MPGDGAQDKKHAGGSGVAAVWGAPLAAVHCSHCQEDHLVAETVVPQRCPLCHHGSLDPLPSPLTDSGPEQTVPFAIDRTQASAILANWARGIWFRPAELAPERLVQRLRRYWDPVWLVDADVQGAWRADVGYDYEVVSHQDRYAEGAGWRSREVMEARVRWEPRAGRIARHYDNVVATAVEEDVRQLLDRLGGYDLGDREPYSPQALESAAVRVAALSQDAAWPLAEPAFVEAAGDDCRKAAGADHLRDFKLNAHFDNRHWTQLLLPAFTTWYEESGHIWPVIVNGQHGRVYGARRASARRANAVSLAMGGIAVTLFILGALGALLGVALPPVAVVGSILVVGGVVLGLAAPAPAISAWIRNRDSRPEAPP